MIYKLSSLSIISFVLNLGLLTKTALDPSQIDYLYYGTVIQESRTSNIAREVLTRSPLILHHIVK